MTYQPQTYRYFLLTQDPVHIGTGGARLGRVDNPIVREPGTRLPKIPGSSLHGMIRAYAAYRYGKPQCAGQGKTHCAQPTCPICYTFGHARDKEGGRMGVVTIGDARILLFPVYSMVGPVWVTSPTALYDAGFRPNSDSAKYFEVDKNEEGKAKWPTSLSSRKYLNLGWLMVAQDDSNEDWKPTEVLENIPDPIHNRVVLVSDKLFSQIVNSNLEMRTSVAINPETGAAEEKALFTYEAIPRATMLWMDVVVSDYRRAFPSRERLEKWLKENGKDFTPDEKPSREDLQRAGWTDDLAKEALNKYQAANLDWAELQDLITSGLEWAEHLGVGGMGTRGFGRIRCLVYQQIPEDAHISCEEQ